MSAQDIAFEEQDVFIPLPKGNYAFKSYQDLKIHMDKSNDTIFEKFDFDKYLLIGISHGRCGSTGYGLWLNDMQKYEDRLIISVNYIFPGSTCKTGAAITHPVKFYKINSFSGSIEFISEEITEDCVESKF